jgi:hypothetical protein
VLVDSGVPRALSEIAEELASQYVVVYSRPDGSAPPKKISVATTRAGAKIRARTQSPRAR